MCETDDFVGNASGLDGEFEDNVQVKLCSVKELEKLKLNEKELEFIKRLVNKKQ